MVAKLPYRIWDGGPYHHGPKTVVLRRLGCREADGVYGRITLLLILCRDEMYKAVQRDTGHYVDEETGVVSDWSCGEKGACHMTTHLTTLSME
jgi:hypothetical protein